MPPKNAIQEAVNSILSFEDVIDCDGNDWTALAGVTFKKDFGPWKADEEVSSLDISYEQSLIFETNEDGDRCGRQCNIKVEISPVV